MPAHNTLQQLWAQVLAIGSSVETGWRVAQTHSKASITPLHSLHSPDIHPYTGNNNTHSRVNQSFSEPFVGLIPQLLASGSRQYLVFHCVKLWSGSVGPACLASPALSMHGSPQLSFYFRSMEAYLGPAGASETMGMLPYPNTGSQTMWRTPGSQWEPRRNALLPNKAEAKG